MYQTCLYYASLGLPIFPCKPNSKQPATQHGFKQATTDLAQIQAWWENRPDLNVAYATGSGIFVLDIDKNKGGFESLARLEKKHGKLPDSWTVTTGGGGIHIYFKCTGPAKTTAGRIGKGIDTRGDGAYVLLPPSVHETGQQYKWKRSPEEVPLAEVPAWLLELIQSRKKSRKKKGRVPHGQRDDFFAQETGSMRRRGYDEDLIFQTLWYLYENECEHIPEDDPEEVKTRLRNLARRGCQNWHPNGKEYLHTDMGNAQRFADMFGNSARFCVAWNTWIIWDGNRWAKDKLLRVQEMAKQSVEAIREEANLIKGDPDRQKAYFKWYCDSQKTERINAILKQAKSTLAISPEDLDQNPWLLNVLNGTVDLQTGKLKPHDREDLITRLAPVKYDPKAKYPTFRRFINDIMQGDQELIEFLQRFLGYSLTGDVRERIFVVFYGNTGSNGKSTLIERIQDVMGDYAIGTRAETLLSKPKGAIPNDIARLYGARFVCANESQEKEKLDEPTVKELTGGEDTITARFLHGEFFDFRPTFKICLRTNHLPRVSADSQAIWDRIRLVPFNMRVRSDNDPNGTVPEDKSLPEKLKNELDGILMWCIEGCLMWQREGLKAPDKVRNATSQYREDEDLIAVFLEDYCNTGPDEKVKAGDVYESYKSWCSKNGHKSLGSQNLKKRLKRRGYEYKRTSEGRHYLGLSLTEEALSDIRTNF